MRGVVVDFSGIGKEQAHGHELALGVPAKAVNTSCHIVTENLPIVKREFPSKGWVNWGINKEKPKWPFNPNTLTSAKANQPETWGTLTAAVKNVKAGKALGIGYEFSEGGELWGIDLDHAIDPETREIATWAREIITELDTYTEVSPSGTGFHLIIKAKGLSADYNKRKEIPGTPGRIEIYGDGQYFTITANIFDNRETINERQTSLLSVYNHFLADKPTADRKPRTTQKAVAKPEKYLEAMLRNPTFAALWNGSRPIGNESQDDGRLMWHLAYWCNRDPVLMKEQFLRSPHCQGKDNRHKKKLNQKVHSGTGELYIDYLVNGALYGPKSQPKTAAEDDKAAQPIGLNTEEGIASVDGYPDIVRLANGSLKPAETLENFKVCLKKYNITVGYNCLSREIIPPKEYTEQYSPVAIKTALLSDCQDFCAKEHIPKNRDRVAGWLSVVADENRVHPVQQYLVKLPAAKGETEIKRLFACLELAESASKNLSYKLLRKWLVQCVAMAYNDAGSYGADGVLILQGAQGIGKTSFFRALCKDLKDCFKEGAEQNEDKDKIIENTKYWITELGELERSTLKEMGSLKSFITAASDEYRAPYAAVSVKYPRYTSLCGTVNQLDFLREDGRRWWIISLEDIDLKKLAEIDMKRLWAEVLTIWRADKNNFRLTKEEQREVIKLSSNFEKRTTEEQVLLDRLNFEEKESLWRWRTTTEITQQLGLPDAVRVGRALKKIKYGEREEALPSRRYQGSTQYLVPPYIVPSYQ